IGLSHQALDAVALDGSTYLFTGGDPDSRPFPRYFQQKHEEMRCHDLTAATLHHEELTTPPESFGRSVGFGAHHERALLLRGRHREPLAALLATTFENGAAAARADSLAEAVRALPPLTMVLIRSLRHDELLAKKVTAS